MIDNDGFLFLKKLDFNDCLVDIQQECAYMKKFNIKAFLFLPSFNIFIVISAPCYLQFPNQSPTESHLDIPGAGTSVDNKGN